MATLVYINSFPLKAGLNKTTITSLIKLLQRPEYDYGMYNGGPKYDYGMYNGGPEYDYGMYNGGPEYDYGMYNGGPRAFSIF